MPTRRTRSAKPAAAITIAALRSLSYDKSVTRVVAAVAPLAKLAEIADAPQLADAHVIHFVSYRRQTGKIAPQDDAGKIPAAHVVEFSKHTHRDVTAS